MVTYRPINNIELSGGPVFTAQSVRKLIGAINDEIQPSAVLNIRKEVPKSEINESIINKDRDEVMRKYDD